MLRKFSQTRVGGGIDPFHLVEDNPFVFQRGVLFFDVIVPSLLLQNMGREPGIEDGIEVYVNEVIEILEILAGHRVAGLVGISKGI